MRRVAQLAWATRRGAAQAAYMRPLAQARTHGTRARDGAALAPAYGAGSAGSSAAPTRVLIDLLASHESPAPERMWQLYQSALSERPRALPDGSISVPATLDAQHHRQVLRALVPRLDAYAGYVAERRVLRMLRYDAHVQAATMPAAVPADLSTPREQAPPPIVRMSASEAAAYVRRVRTIFAHMPVGTARAADYNVALSVLAMGGHYDEMAVLYDEMRATPSTAPDMATYGNMMQGLFRHFQRLTERLQQGYGHALLPTDHARRLALTTRREGSASRVVLHAAQNAARRASALIADMQAAQLLPDVYTLDVAARLLRITGQLPALLTLLRAGFGVDVAHPDVPPEVPAPCAATTQTLNTALMALGEHATVPDMAVAYEIMTRPMPPAPPVAGENHVAPAGPAAHRGALPNATTFALLLKHACTAPDTLFLSGALVQAPRSLLSRLASSLQGERTVGFRSRDERDAEVQRRRRGAYVSFARAFADECLAQHAAQLALMAQRLGYAVPPVVAMDVGATSALVREGAEGTPPRLAAGAPRAATAAAPVFVPPLVTLSVPLLYPLVTLASRRRTPSLLRWVQTRAERAYALVDAEAQLVAAAVAAHEATPLAPSLAAHAARTERQRVGLAWLCYERLPARIDEVCAAHAERAERRAAHAAAHPRRKKSRR